jgi:SNF2 family DNA or RNA helicase
MGLIDYSHQTTGAAFLAERRFALLADEPGLGKTRTTVLAADLVGAEKILVLCPGAVRRHWEAEFEQWSSRRRDVTVMEGFLDRPPGPGVTIVSHAVTSDAPAHGKKRGGRSVPALLEGGPYDAVIVDEAHEFRQYQAQRTRTLFAPDGIASRAAHCWNLSGTPIVNSAGDLYPMVFGGLGSPISWQDFCNHYAIMVPDTYLGTKPTGIQNAEELARGLQPYMIRRTIASLGIPMPPLDIQSRSIDIDQDALRRIMADLDGWTPTRLAEAMEDQDDLKDAVLARVRRALGLAKVNATARHILDIFTDGDGPVVVFFQHTDVRKELYSILSSCNLRCSWIDGTVSKGQLAAAKAWFQDGRLDVLLVQTQAGGMGLTLTRAHRAVIAEMPWTATALFQAIKRIHRIGQTAGCLAETLAASGCWLDAAMAKVVGVKERASNRLLDLLTSSV